MSVSLPRAIQFIDFINFSVIAGESSVLQNDYSASTSPIGSSFFGAGAGSVPTSRTRRQEAYEDTTLPVDFPQFAGCRRGSPAYSLYCLLNW
jgi:hypothetical protein